MDGTQAHEESKTTEYTTGIYAGVNNDGTKHTLIIGETNWYWKRSRFMNSEFNGMPVGQMFKMDSKITWKNGRAQTLGVDWETFVWMDQKSEEIGKEYALINAAGKRIKMIKSTANKLNTESIRNMTLQEIREQAVFLSAQQKAALLAIVIAEVA